MKNFKDLLSEVAQPKSPEEKAFKDQHKIELIKHPVAPDYVHTGEIKGVTKKERPADSKAGEDEKKYDGGAAAKAKPFKMPRNIDENKLTFKGLIEKVSDTEDLLESPQEEVSMMMKQLHFICYASEEIMEYLGAEDMDPEEWWQNKLAVVFSNVKSLFAYAKGSEVVKKDIEQDDDLDPDMAADDDVSVPDDAEVDNIMNSMYEGLETESKIITEAFLLSEAKIDVDYIGDEKTTAAMEKRFNVKISLHGPDKDMAFVSGDAKDVWKYAVFHYDGDKDDAASIHPNLAKEAGYEVKEEVELDEAAKMSANSQTWYRKGYEMGKDPSKYQNPPYGIGGAAFDAFRKGRKAGEEALKNKKEKVNEANFKPGSLKLKSGEVVKLDHADSEHLNAMLNGLNPKNKKEMEDQLHTDKKGFEEILKFATKAGI